MFLKWGLLAALTIAVYWPAMHSAFVYDDAHTVVSNELVRYGGISVVNPRALTLATYRANLLTTGQNPLYFHLGNLAIHVVNGLLVAFATQSLLGFTEAQSLFASGIFLLHPLQSEAVIYISGRSELLALMFILVSVLCFDRRWYFPAFLAFFLAVTGKEIALVTPALWWMVAAMRGRRFWLAGIAFAGGLLLSPVRPYLEIIRQNMNISEFYAIAALLWRAVLPIRLNIDHDFTEISRNLAILAAFGIGAAVIVGLWKRKHVAGFALLWILVLLLPHVLVEPQGYLAEHHFYAPMFGISVLFALCLRSKAVNVTPLESYS